MQTFDTNTSAQNQLKIRWLQWTLAGGAILAVVKFTAYWLTHSNAIFTDALESMANIAAGLAALYSLWLAAKPRDRAHPYGHGKVEFLSSGFEAVLIMGAGVATVVKAGYGLAYPQPLHSLDVGFVLTLVAGAANFGMGYGLAKAGKRHHSPTLIADGQHLMSDGYSSLGLLIGLAIIYFTNIAWLDGVVAILFGLLIFYTGWKILRGALAGVMDEADQQLVEEVVSILARSRRPTWIDVHNLRIIKYGAHLHIDCHLTLPWYFTVQEAHDEIKAIEAQINEPMGNRVEIFIHSDPCLPMSCAICQLAQCPKRQAPFKQAVEWSMANVVHNGKHSAGND